MHCAFADCRPSTVAQNSVSRIFTAHNIVIVSSFFFSFVCHLFNFRFVSVFAIHFPISDVIGITQDSDILSLGTGAVSWFEVNGYGCMPTYPTNITSEDPFRLVRPEYVDGCLLEWYTVEIIQSTVQLCLAVIFIKKFNLL